jgi:carboxyl-terminal processing protease
MSRALFSLLVVALFFAVLGGVFGSHAQGTQKAGDAEDISTKLFTSLIGLVEENYATEVDSDKALYGAIDGMLRTLDPHSKFFDPKSFNSLREDQRGKYFGLGITVAARFGKVRGFSAFPGVAC